MPPTELPPPVWVDTPAGLASLAGVLARQSVIAVDTESNSLHAYRERVCLIQFSTARTDYLLDPLAIADLSPLSPLLADPALEKVLHAAEYDLICLQRDFGWQFRSIFDTMIAARTLGWPHMGLAAMLKTHFAVKLNKRYQRTDWGRRPLAVDQLAYARLDTHYLIPLRNILAAELEAKKLRAEADEEFRRLADNNSRDSLAPAAFDPEAFWRISGARDLPPRQAAVLRELFVYRDQAARRLDRPPFKVMSEDTLVALARAQPHSLQALKRLPGMTPGQIRRHGPQILKAVARGQEAPLRRPPGPAARRAPDAAMERFETLRRWRKQRAQQRGVEADVIVPRGVLWEIAERRPRTGADLERIAGLGPVRRSKYGAEILEVLKGTD